MVIKVVSGKGVGGNLLSAFDSALQDCGVSNYNLIRLSSIIPPNSTIEVVDRYETPGEDFGKKLYVVQAEKRSDHAGKFLGAGIGWYPLEEGKGLFVEHETENDTEETVRTEIEHRIRTSLKDLCEFRGYEFDESNMNFELSIVEVKNKPSCALVLAIYKAEGWD